MLRAGRGPRRSRRSASAPPASSTSPARPCCSHPTWPGATSRCSAELERRTDLPVVIENDANAAAWGEFAFGAGADAEDLLLVTVGTGVGGGIVLDGKLHRGAFGIAAEIGHLRVVPARPPVPLRQPRLLGAVRQRLRPGAGRQGAARRRRPQAKPLLDRAGGDVEAITGPLITEAAQDGDAFAVELARDAGPVAG